MSVVLLDVEILRKAPCGLAEVCQRLGRALLEQAEPDIGLMFLVHPQYRHYLGAPCVSTLRPRRWLKRKYLRAIGPLVSRWAPFPPYSLWHATNQNCRYLPLRNDVPVVLTLHDLNFLYAGKSSQRIARETRRLQERVDRATAIATGSHFAAREIAQHLDLKGKPVHVIYHGRPPAATEPDEAPDLPLRRPFLFSIGQFRSTKNFHVLVELMHHLPDRQLVLAGDSSSDYGGKVRSEIERRGLHDRVFLPGEISDANRQWLYRHCEAFVFPSGAEGFGLPVLEAMDMGRPVFLNRATSLPEVGGSLAFYWDSLRPDDMARAFRDGMASFHRDPDYGAKLRRHAESFSWSKAARQYLDLYRRVLAESGRGHRRKAA
jgi:glycosyltransferase involved in cell wall biosynthesis